MSQILRIEDFNKQVASYGAIADLNEYVRDATDGLRKVLDDIEDNTSNIKLEADNIEMNTDSLEELISGASDPADDNLPSGSLFSRLDNIYATLGTVNGYASINSILGDFKASSDTKLDSVITAVSNVPESVSTVVSGKTYQIVSLGTTTTSEWEGLGTDATPTVNEVFEADASGSSLATTGTVRNLSGTNSLFADVVTSLSDTGSISTKIGTLTDFLAPNGGTNTVFSRLDDIDTSIGELETALVGTSTNTQSLYQFSQQNKQDLADVNTELGFISASLGVLGSGDPINTILTGLQTAVVGSTAKSLFDVNASIGTLQTAVVGSTAKTLFDVNASIGTLQTAVVGSTAKTLFDVNASIGTLQTAVVGSTAKTLFDVNASIGTLKTAIIGSSTKSLTDVDTTVTTIKTAVDLMKNTMLDNEATSVGNIVSAKEYEVVTIGTTTGEQWTDLGASLANAVPAIGTIFTAISNGNGSIGNGTVYDLSDTINLGTISTNLGTVSSSVGTVNTSIGTLKDAVVGTSSNIKNLYDVDTSVGAVNTSVGTVNTSVGTVNTSIGTLQEAVVGTSTNVKSLFDVNASIGTLKDAVVGGTAKSLFDVDTSVGTVNTSVGTVNTSVGTVNSSIGTVNTSVGTVNTSIGNLQEALIGSSGSKNLKDIEATLETIKSAIDTLNTTLNDVYVTTDSFENGSNSNINDAAASEAPEALTAETFACKKGVTITASMDNDGIIYIGKDTNITAGSTDATDGIPLTGGDSIFLPLDDPTSIYILADTSGQKIYWVAL